MKKILALLTLYIILSCSTSFAAITLNVVATDINWTASGPLGYNPFDTNTYKQEIFVDLDFTVNEDTDIVVGFSKGSYLLSYIHKAYGSLGNLSFTFHKNDTTSTRLKDYSNFKNTEECFMFKLSPTDISPLRFSFFMEVPAEQSNYKDTYIDKFDINVYKGTNQNVESLIASKELQVSIPLGAIINMSTNEQVFGNNSPYIINLGSSSSGKKTDFTIKIRSTCGYNITALSENSNKLKHIDDAISYKLPYEYRIGLIKKSLSDTTPTAIFSSLIKTSTTGKEYSGSITIPDTSQAPAGEYSDTITYTIAEY